MCNCNGCNDRSHLKDREMMELDLLDLGVDRNVHEDVHVEVQFFGWHCWYDDLGVLVVVSVSSWMQEGAVTTSRLPYLLRFWFEFMNCNFFSQPLTN